LSKREFLKELAEIFREVKTSYEKEIIELMRRKKILKGEEIGKLTLVERNGRTAYVLLTANTSLYGNIVYETFKLFMEYFKRGDGDPVIVGRLGRLLFEEAAPGTEYTFFDFPDNRIELANFEWVAEYLLRYKRIFVFHGEFRNIVFQKPQVSSVSGDELEIPGVENIYGEKVAPQYIFEPTLEDVMVFFENEIVALILEQAVYEGQLAKFASRMYLLEQSLDNIKKRLDEVELQARMIQQKENNKKQQERLAAIWAR
jgi:F0F1-type ATP synthase gamma subunit